MVNLRFTRLPKYRKFNYQPVYYDEQKEELHTRVDDIKREMGEIEHTSDSAKEGIRRAYQFKMQETRYGTAPSDKFYTLKIVAIAVILCLISYKLWNTDVIEIIFEHLKK